MDLLIGTVDAQPLFGGIIIQESKNMVRKGPEIVGDFLPIVTTRADEAGFVYSDGAHGGFKLGKNIL